MDISPEIEAKVQQYLSRKLNEEEIASFEKLMAEDESLKQYVGEQQKLRLAIGAWGNKHLKAQLEELGKELVHKEVGSDTQPSSRGIRPLYVGLALAASLALVLYFFLPQAPNKMDSQEILAQYFPVDQEFPAQQRSSDQNSGPIDSLFNLASNSFYNKNYTDAISLFQQLLAIDSTDVESAYFLGLSYAQMAEWEKSNRMLKGIDPSSYYADRAEWFQVANGIQSGNPSRAKEILTAISQDRLHEYFEQAQHVLAQLKE